MTTHIPFIARLGGRCANGFERDGGRISHVVLVEPPSIGPTYQTALCGAKPGRLSIGWDEVDGAEQPNCRRCRAKLEKQS